MKTHADNRISLESERLHLRPLCASDAAAVFEHWASDPEVTRFLRWEPYESLGDATRWLADVQREYDETDNYCYGIERKSDGRLIGSIGAYFREEDGRTEIGYCLERAFWGQGYMTEACRTLVRFLHEHEGLRRLKCAHSPENPASGKVMRASGFVFQGCTEKCIDGKGNFMYDALVYHLDFD